MNPEEYRQLMRLGETHWWFVGTRDILLSRIPREELPSGPILDVGCGSGLMMKRLAETGKVFGVDSDYGALAHCKDMGFDRVCLGDAARLPFGPDKFALVIASDVIEHCDDDSAALDELFRVTRHGGRVLVSVPAYGALWSSHDVALHHRRRYSRRQLVDRVRAAGFEIEQATYFNTLLFPPAALVRLTLGKIEKPEGRIKYHGDLKPLNKTLLGLLRLEKLWLSRFNFPFGLSILLLASKK